MTIGIVAAADGGRSIVVASDRLRVNTSLENLVFESNEKPIFPDAHHVVMCSGDSETTRSIISSVPPSALTSTENYGVACETAFLSRVRERLQRKWEPPPVGGHLAKFIWSVSTLWPMYKAGRDHRVGEQIIVAGFSDKKAKIGWIEHPYGLQWCAARTFHIVGVGADRAAEALLIDDYNEKQSLAAILFCIYSAKRRAEKTLGVGSATDMFVVTEDAPTLTVTAETLSTLEREYVRTRIGAPDLAKIEKSIGS